MSDEPRRAAYAVSPQKVSDLLSRLGLHKGRPDPPKFYVCRECLDTGWVEVMAGESYQTVGSDVRPAGVRRVARVDGEAAFRCESCNKPRAQSEQSKGYQPRRRSE